MLRKSFLLIFFVCFSLFIFAQDSPNYEQTRKKIEHSIEYTDSLIQQVNKTQNSSTKLQIINRRIDDRRKLIKVVKQESLIIEGEIEKLKQMIISLEFELKTIKEEYAKMIYYAYKNRNPYDKWMFILSAENFNQSYKRLKYLQQYGDYRRKQVEKIIKTKNIIGLKIKQLEGSKAEEEKLLKMLASQSTALVNDQSELGKIKTSLQREQSRLMIEQKVKQQLSDELAKNIENQINTELQNDKVALKANPMQEKRIGRKMDLSDFSKNRGLLPWPTEEGIIYNYFGVHPHPVLANIFISNSGIDIITKPGVSARAIFEGKVSKIIAIPGNNQAVLISHGEFYTVYSNLSQVAVNKGDIVKAKQKIGKIYTDSNEGNQTRLQFQIWKGITKQDPLEWLYQK